MALFNQIPVTFTNGKSLQLLPALFFGGNLNVAVCLSYSKASPQDCSLLLDNHKTWYIQQIRNKHYLHSSFFFRFVFQIHFVSGRWSTLFWPHVCGICQTWEQRLWGIIITILQAGFRVCFTFGLLWPEIHPMSLCFLEYIQQKRQFHTRVVQKYVRGWHGTNMYSALKSTTS